MSSHELPADLTRWPDDPFALLGVRPGVLPRDLRRAYTRLIRTYKPEHFPEHFRRLREAYERIRPYVEAQAVPTPEPVAAPQPDHEDPGYEARPEATLPREETANAGRRRPPLRSLLEEVHEAWEFACGGEEAFAYELLLELHERHPGHAEVCLRLYWLLAVRPDLDARRAPCTWLVHGLRANGLTGPLRELYRRELAADPREALSERCARLLSGLGRPGQIADLAVWRWQAAGRLQRWGVLARDLDTLRARMIRDDEEAWVRLLCAAVDQLAWAEDEAPAALMKECCREIGQFDHLHARLAAELDRLDFLLELAAGWRAVQAEAGLGGALAALVPLSWTRDFTEVRPPLLALLEHMALHAEEALASLDRLQGGHSAVLAQLGHLLGQFQDTVDLSGWRPPAALARLIREFVEAHAGPDYPAFRPRLLAFCLREAVSPEDVAANTEDHPEYGLVHDGSLSQAVAADWPLRYVCWAHRLFWS